MKTDGPSQALEPLLAGQVDARFRRITSIANRALVHHEAVAAHLYAVALAKADRLFDAAMAGGSPLIAPMAHTVACNNIAACKNSAGDHAAARALRLRAVQKLIDTAESGTGPLAFRMNCVRHLRHALAFVFENSGSDGGYDTGELESLLNRCRAISRRFASIADRVAAHAGSAVPPPRDQLN